MKIPFRHADHRGHVSVISGQSAGSAESGFDFLGVPYNRLSSAGFPTMRASVSYSGSGYRRFFGWIQIVEHDLGRRRVSVVDVPPALIGLGLPFAAFGECPTLYDSPATSSKQPAFFAAETFLCAVSPVDRKVPIRPLAAFGWGYTLDAAGTIARRAASSLPLVAWNAHIPLLRRSCPRWRYQPA